MFSGLQWHAPVREILRELGRSGRSRCAYFSNLMIDNRSEPIFWATQSFVCRRFRESRRNYSGRNLKVEGCNNGMVN